MLLSSASTTLTVAATAVVQMHSDAKIFLLDI